MAQINITPTRTKQSTTVTLDEDLLIADTTGAEITDIEAVSATELALPVVIESLPSDICGADGSYTANSPGGTGSTITLTNVSAGLFTMAKVGDLVFGINVTANEWNGGATEDDPTQDTGGDEDFTAGQGTVFASGAYISAIDSGAQTISITVAAGDVLIDQTARTGGEIAFRRNGIKVTLAHLGLRVNVTGGQVTLAPVLYLHDGTLAADGATQNSYDGLATTDAQSNVVFSGQTIQYDTFLTNARVARTNS